MCFEFSITKFRALSVGIILTFSFCWVKPFSKKVDVAQYWFLERLMANLFNMNKFARH